MAKALEGIRVLDLSNVLAGPFCAYQLALLGAEVIKVEVPDSGDLARQLGADPDLNERKMGASFLAQNGGKQSLTLNLKKPEGKEILTRLVRTADVLIENFRPGVMDRLGVGYDVLREFNPKLVYCAISGFGQDGPMRSAPAYDQIVQGLSGVMSITGDKNSAPQRVGYPMADTVGGITAAFAVASALVRQARSGVGEFIDVSMLDSTIVTMGWIVSNFLIAGKTPTPMGNENFTASPSGTFKTGNGLLNIAANKQEQFQTLVEVLERPDLAFDDRFAEREARKANRAALTVELEAALARKSAIEWEEILSRRGVPAGRVLAVADALSHPQTVHRELLTHFDNVPGIDRSIHVVRSGFKMRGGNPDIDTPPPQLGEHTNLILASLGYSADEIATLRSVEAV